MPDRNAHEHNRAAWNAATLAHDTHRPNQAAFYRSGGSTLFPEDRDLLGELRGQHVAHLQCNAGQDTLSLMQEGAASVTGVDISDTAIALARALSDETDIPATFIRSDLYDWLSGTDDRFDIAYTSYGALNWLSDIGQWAAGAARILKPGGRLVVVEYHPTFGIFENDWQITFPALGGVPVVFEEGIGDYVADTGLAPGGYEAGTEGFVNPNPSHEFSWGIGDIVGAVLNAGLRLTALREYPYSNGFKRFPDMRELPGGRFAMPEGMPDIPMMFGLVAEKPGNA
jgi:SAM-dependent methyltransferase